MNCKFCRKEFQPSKYKPRQEVCSNKECQNQRLRQNMRDWRLKNPDYFKHFDKISIWAKDRQEYCKKWRITHKEQITLYVKQHKIERRNYMREYMRKYRSTEGAHPSIQ